MDSDRSHPGDAASQAPSLPPIPSIAPRTGPLSRRVSLLGSWRPIASTIPPKAQIPGLREDAKPMARRGQVLAGAVLASVLAVGALFSGTRLSHREVKAVRQVVSGKAAVRTTSSGADERWGAGSITVTIDPTIAALTPSAKEALINAFGAWSATGAGIPKVTVNTTTTAGKVEQDGVNRLLFGPITEPGQEHALALTISYTDVATGAILEADTIFNSEYRWTSVGSGSSAVGGSDEYDLQNVAAHEVGHFFGLGEDYDDTGATMYYASLPFQTSKRTPTATDIAVMSGLYSQPVPATTNAGGCGARIANGHGTDGTDGKTLAALCASALIGIRRRRRA